MTWPVERAAGDAHELHHRAFSERRLVTICEPSARAIVVGSTQPAPGHARLPVVRRRSGGGAVVVGPDEVLWVDVDVPKGDPTWDDDVGRSFWWLGEVWRAALLNVGLAQVEAHHGAAVCTPWCREICFAGIGQGEVTVAGKKVVGLSQRRSREGARFHCAVLLRWDPQPLIEAFGLGDDDAGGLGELAAPAGVEAAELERAFLAALPA